MADLLLYHAAPSRSSTVRWMLEEVGEPYDIHLLKLAENDQNKPAYLAINPQGKVPALKHKGVVITEVAAICAYLADEFPRAKLNVPIGNPRRGVYLKWLFFGPSCIEPAMIDRAFPRKEEPRRGMLGYGDSDTARWSSPRRRRSAPTWPTSFHAPSSTCRSGTRAAASISNGCSSARAASNRR